MHRRALPLVPFAIRWGEATSSDVLRRNLKCSRCGRKGAVTFHPSWVDDMYGWQLRTCSAKVADEELKSLTWLGAPEQRGVQRSTFATRLSIC